jgi:hypothetical protein
MVLVFRKDYEMKDLQTLIEEQSTLFDKEFGVHADGKWVDSNEYEDAPDDYKDFLRKSMEMAYELNKPEINGETSDGYHTFNELYEFRKLYNACLFNEWWGQGRFSVTKSKRHDDGELCFGGGWFVVTAQLPTGQISNHYELKDWDLFRCDEFVNSPKWDGHTPQDVAKRLNVFLSQPTNSTEEEI